MSDVTDVTEKHHKLSPSAAHRWLECPGSLTITVDREDEPSAYAAEGTRAHDLAHTCWVLGVGPDEWVRKFPGMPVEMREAVKLYLDEIEAASEGAVNVFTEQHIVDPEIADFGGTLDCVIVHERSITIIDFKYGAGVVVEAEENPQLLSYARLAQTRFGDLPVTVTIVQPRAYHPDGSVRTWRIPAGRIEKFLAEIEAATRQPNRFHAGDHCRWCPARVDCPELAQLTLDMAREEFDPGRMTAHRAADVLGKAKAALAYLDAVKDWAAAALKRGERVPGYKLVKSLGHRRWAVDEETVIKRCRSKGLGKKQVTEAKLLSPAQLEKLTDRKFVDGLSTRPVSGLSVVPESDRRPAFDPVTEAQEEFAQCQLQTLPEC